MIRKFGKTVVTAETIDVIGIAYRGTNHRQYTVTIQTTKSMVNELGAVEFRRRDFEIEVSEKEYTRYKNRFFDESYGKRTAAPPEKPKTRR